jgi:hypothetical protein
MFARAAVWAEPEAGYLLLISDTVIVPMGIQVFYPTAGVFAAKIKLYNQR